MSVLLRRTERGDGPCECPCRTGFQSPTIVIDVLFVETHCHSLVSGSQGVMDRLLGKTPHALNYHRTCCQSQPRTLFFLADMILRLLEGGMEIFTYFFYSWRNGFQIIPESRIVCFGLAMG